MGYTRDDVLTRIDLDQLCDELLGPHKGRGHGASWPCPDPQHGPQTGKTPPVTVFRPRSGIERWHCHGCGAGGTAIDLVMRTEGVPFPEALELLGRRVGAIEAPPWEPRPARPRAEPPPPPPSADPSPALETFVSACEDWLWGPNGRAMRRYLDSRGLGEEVLRANRVGADPGPRALPREAGLPRAGPAVVFPLFDEEGRVVYLQARYLSSNGRKYDNPSASLVPASPRLGEVRTPGAAQADDTILICEGLPDALTAAQAGYRAVAVLGAGLPDERLARALLERYPDENLVVAFDADPRGRAGAERLAELLGTAGAGERVAELHVPAEFGDLNAWARAAGNERFQQGLATELSMADPTVDIGLAKHKTNFEHIRPDITKVPRTRPAAGDDGPGDDASEGLEELLETLAYKHFLLDDGATVARNVESVADALSDWRAGQDRVSSSAPEDDRGGLEDLLDRIGYHHVLVDDKEIATPNLDRVDDMVQRWSAFPTGNTALSQATDDIDVLLAKMAEPPGLDGPGLGL